MKRAALFAGVACSVLSSALVDAYAFPGDIVIQSDSDWVAVSTQLTPGLTEIQGNLVITNTVNLKGSDIGGLFKDLTRIVGAVTISGNKNESFSLNGLNSVEKIHGNLLISKNPGMRSVGGFTNLKQIDRSLSILDHSELEILGGFQALMIVGEVLTISRNSKLVTVSAFDAIEYFLDGQILIEDNPELVSIEGFNLVSEVHNDIIIRRNDALILLDSFHALTRIGASLTVAFNAKLADC